MARQVARPRFNTGKHLSSTNFVHFMGLHYDFRRAHERGVIWQRAPRGLIDAAQGRRDLRPLLPVRRNRRWRETVDVNRLSSALAVDGYDCRGSIIAGADAVPVVGQVVQRGGAGTNSGYRGRWQASLPND